MLGEDSMGENAAAADSSIELPRLDSRREAPGQEASALPIQTGSKLPNTLVIPEQSYFEQIIENAPEAISIVDRDRKILRINGEFTRMFGFTPAEALGKRLDHLIVPPDRYTETAWIAESVKNESKISLETRRQRKDGSLIEVLLSTASIILNGETVGAYASYRDITEQKRAEELNAALYAIAARSQSAEDLQQFFAAIHNIVGQLMNARNFYIALYDPQSQLLSFPYFVDEEDPIPSPKPLGYGLTEYVLRSGEP